MSKQESHEPNKEPNLFQKEKHTLFLKRLSRCFDQSLAEVAVTEATAISTPLDSVPLYTVPNDVEPITLLKSSQAASSSDLFSFGTPEFKLMF